MLRPGFARTLHVSARQRIVVVGYEHDRNGFASLNKGLQQGLGAQGDEDVWVGTGHGRCLSGQV